MSVLSIVTIGGREVVVEVEPAQIALPAAAPGIDAPPDAELTNFGDRLRDASQTIRNTIGGITDAVMEAFETVSPDEFSVEIGLTFKGENQPIPVLVKVAGEASIKVTATWKKAGP